MPHLWNAHIQLTPPPPAYTIIREQQGVSIHQKRQNTISVGSQDYANFLAVFHDLISKNLD